VEIQHWAVRNAGVINLAYEFYFMVTPVTLYMSVLCLSANYPRTVYLRSVVGTACAGNAQEELWYAAVKHGFSFNKDNYK
jgi:hypothetical protein